MLLLMLVSCAEQESLKVQVFETSAAGLQLSERTDFPPAQGEEADVVLKPEQTFQTITGFGGSFTEASASLLNRLSSENRKRILEAYFGDDGARYSLTRTHMNSCDFSLSNYYYAPVEGDMELEIFSI